jgi:hypothetical protein
MPGAVACAGDSVPGEGWRQRTRPASAASGASVTAIGEPNYNDRPREPADDRFRSCPQNAHEGQRRKPPCSELLLVLLISSGQCPDTVSFFIGVKTIARSTDV